MNRKLGLTWLLFIVLILNACSALGAGHFIFVELDKPFTLKINQTANLDNHLSITFNSVLADGRCPEGVTCVWAGNAKVSISIVFHGQQSQLELNTNKKSGPRTAILNSYKITVVALMPRPRFNVESKNSSYQLTLIIQRVLS